MYYIINIYTRESIMAHLKFSVELYLKHLSSNLAD